MHPGENGFRSTEAVFRDHLHKRQVKDLDDDIATNYADDVVLLTGTGIYQGHDGVRHTAAILRYYQPDATYDYRTERVEGEYAFLEWTSTSPAGDVCDGADGYVIRKGRIVAQMIHYTVRRG